MSEVNSKKQKKSASAKKTKNSAFSTFSNSLRTISGILILITTALLPVLYFQEDVLLLQTVKLSFFYFTTALSAILYLVSFVFERKKKIVLTFDILSCSLFLALITYVLAGFFSQNTYTSVWGRDFSIDSVLSVLFYFIYGYVTFLHAVKDKTYIAKVIFALFITSVVSCIFHIGVIMLQLGGITASVGISESLVGAWTNLAIYNFVIAVIALFLVNQKKIQRQVKIAAWIVLVLNVISLLLVASTVIWIQVTVTALLIVVFYLFTKREVHIAACAVVLIGGISLLSGNALNSYVASNSYVSTETRLGLSETLTVAEKTLREHPVLGVGPSQFENKLPNFFTDILVSGSYWRTDFRYGYSYLTTLPTNVGIIGSIPWAAIPLGVLFLLVLFYSRGLFVNSYQHTVIFGAVLVMLNLYVCLLTYIPSATILVLNSLTVAVILAFGYQQKLIPSKQVDLSIRKSFTATAIVVSLVFVAVLTLFLVESAQKVYAEYLFQKSRIVFQSTVTEKNIITAASLVAKASDVNGIDTYYRSRALLLQRQLELLVSDVDNEETEKILNIISEINSLYVQSLQFDRDNYYTYVDIGNFYRSIMILSEGDVADQSYAEAMRSYGYALQLKPDYPPILLEIAKMEFVRNEILQVRAILDQILKTRPDYIDGIVYNIEFEKSRGNTRVAERLLENAIAYNSANPDAIILLTDEQLNKGDINGAIKTLKKLDNIGYNSTSVIIEISDILESQSRFEDAITILERSQKINGNDERVQARITILKEKQSNSQ